MQLPLMLVKSKHTSYTILCVFRQVCPRQNMELLLTHFYSVWMQSHTQTNTHTLPTWGGIAPGPAARAVGADHHTLCGARRCMGHMEVHVHTSGWGAWRYTHPFLLESHMHRHDAPGARRRSAWSHAQRSRWATDGCRHPSSWSTGLVRMTGGQSGTVCRQGGRGWATGWWLQASQQWEHSQGL